MTGNKEKIPNDYFLKLSKEALAHYNKCRKEKCLCELRYDDTISTQAEAFIELFNTGKINFTPKQQDDYCFARAFNLIDKKEGEKRWADLKGHESNRLEEMEIQLKKLAVDKPISSKDHRVVQALAMLGIIQNKKPIFLHPECVSKSWPQFWEFLKFVNGSIIKQ